MKIISSKLKILLGIVGIFILIVIIVAFYLDTTAGLFALAIGLAMGLTFSIIIYCIGKDVDRLNKDIRDFRHGYLDVYTFNGGEGSLSLLSSEIYGLAERLNDRELQFSETQERWKNSLSDVAHQLKTPIMAMSVMLDLLDSPKLDKDKRYDFLNNLRTSLNHMEWMVFILLKISRLDANVIIWDKQEISVNELIERSVNLTATFIDAKHLNVHIERSGENLFVTLDIAWTVEALSNIIKNAAEHSILGKDIDIAYGQDFFGTWITVSDYGTGISKEDLPNIFKRFYRSKNATSGGVGIGLPLARAILRNQGGDVEVVSKAGDKKTTFMLKIYS